MVLSLERLSYQNHLGQGLGKHLNLGGGNYHSRALFLEKRDAFSIIIRTLLCFQIYVIVVINHESFVKFFKVSFSFFMGDFEPEMQDLYLNLSPFVNFHNHRARNVHDSIVIDLKTSVEVDYE